MGRHATSLHVNASPDVAFDLYTNFDRMPEWIGGVTSVSDVTGPVDRAGTRYTVWFGGRTASPTEILEADRPYRIVTHFGNWILRGQNSATFDHDGDGTRMTVTLDTEGLFPALMARISRSARGGVASKVSSGSSLGWPKLMRNAIRLCSDSARSATVGGSR